ncbi:MAG: tRNA 2-thiouridine(34) synthase MnmA [Patescibacteria group bacterium]
MKKVNIIHPEKSRMVFVGLSGGVDSAVSAALLKKDGFNVTGVFIKAWTPEGYPCTWKEDRRSAMKVAAILDIPFITLDLEKEYKKEVVDYMIAEYKTGRTPNPDVMCNKEIKFGHFLKFALKNGANFVATGHYAQISHSKLPRKVLEKSLACATRRPEDFSERSFSGQLLEGKDKNKDQSYFLWTLTQEQLKHILFPIGGLQKSEVRKLADKFGLPQATRKDSQGLCFLGKVDMKEFLSRYMPPQKGNVINENEEIIGTHNGALFFTIGERHGFTITKKSEKEEPLYVTAKNIEKNTIMVASIARKKLPLKKSSGLLAEARPDFSIDNFLSGCSSVFLKDINITEKIPNKNLTCRIRYRQEKIGCKMDRDKVTFNKSQMGVAPGQSLVLYQDEVCLGGGIIK